MENLKRKTNKSVAARTLKSALILTVLIMAAPIGGCAAKNKNHNNVIGSSSITSRDNEEKVANSSDATINEDSKAPEQKETNSQPDSAQDNSTKIDAETAQNEKQPGGQKENNVTNNNTASNGNSSTKNSNTSNNTDNNNNNNGNNNSQDPSQNEDGALIPFSPLTAENIKDPRIFERAVYELGREIMFKDEPGTTTAIYVYYYNDKRCVSSLYAEEENRVVLALANQNYLNGNDYVNIFEDRSLEDLKKCIYILQVFDVRTLRNTKINWQTLVVNKELGNYIMDMQNKTYEQLINGVSDFEQSFKQYYYEKKGQFVYGDNAFLDALITGYAIAIYRDDPDSDIYFDVYYANQDAMKALESELSVIYNKMPSHTKVSK